MHRSAAGKKPRQNIRCGRKGRRGGAAGRKKGKNRFGAGMVLTRDGCTESLNTVKGMLHEGEKSAASFARQAD